MMWAISQAVMKAAQVVIMAVREAEIPANTTRPALAMPKTGGPVLKQPTFDWKAIDKYIELCNFEIEVKTSFLTATTSTAEKSTSLLNGKGMMA